MVRWRRQTSGTTSPTPRSRRGRIARLLWRRLLGGLMWLLIVAALLAGGLLGSGALRERILHTGLAVVAKSVPGELTLAEAAWPTLGHLRLTDLVWCDGRTRPDTLAHVARLDIRLDMGALRARDVRVDSLQLLVRWLDGPGIAAALANRVSGEDDSGPVAAVSDSTRGKSVIREGAVPGLPSVAVAHWQVAVTAAALTADMNVADVVCAGALEAGHGHEAWAVVDHLEGDLALTVLDSLTGQPWEISLAHLGLGTRLVAEPDSLADRGLVGAVIDSLSLRFDTVGGSGAADADAPGAWWQASGPVRLLNSGHISREGGGYEAVFNSEFVLPGAVEFKALLPENFPHTRFDKVAGRLSLTGQYSQPRLDLALDVDLGATRWLDTGRLAGRIGADLDKLIADGLSVATVALDTLDFSLLGSSLRARGTLRQGDVDLALRVALVDSQLVTVFLEDTDDAVSVAADLEAAVSGPMSRPQVTLTLAGGVDSAPVRVPRLSLRIDAGPDGGQLVASLGGGVSAAGVSLDSAVTEIEFRRSDGDSLVAAATVAAWRGADRLALGVHAWADSLGRSVGRELRVDSLVVGVFGQEMRLAAATTLVLGPGPLDFDLTPLVFAGDLGEISVGGRIDEAGLDLAGSVRLLFPEALLNVMVPSSYWSSGGGTDFSLAADAEVLGPRDAPTMGGHLAARLLSHRAEPNLGVDLDFDLAGADTAGFKADLAVVVADSVVLQGHVYLPAGLDQAGKWRLDGSRAAVVSIPEQTLGLARLNRMLPENVALEGPLKLEAEIRTTRAGGAGSREASGAVTGHLLAEDLTVRLPNRSRLKMGVELRASGGLDQPKLSGRVEIESGFFRIPELPRDLHPVTGEALLWSLAAGDSTGSVADSLVVFVAPESSGPVVDSGGPRMLPELDLEILAPGNLRLHGYGLDTELAGDLKVERGVDADGRPQPKIHGDVHTVEGTLQFMNRVFDLERGEVRFAGEVPANPLLDMVLETDVNGTVVRILVSGTASDPVVELNSEPDLPEQDIMGVLLFGRPLGELDDDQRGGVEGEMDAGQQLRQNLAGLAMVFGTAGLQNRMSNTFGVDMVEVGSGSEGDATLMVGKFINPKVMLKYHHSLEKSGTYFLTMEYTLSRLFRLVTTYGQGEEDSGLEFKWSRRY